MKRGRPPSYKTEYVVQARKLCDLGATDLELADFFGVHVATLNRWKSLHPDFCASIKTGKAEADERVERSLYHKAIGYSFDSEKVFQFQGTIVRAKTREHVAPDATACIFWLKNRRQQQWRDVHKHEVGQPGDFDAVSDVNELRKRLIAEATELGQGDIASALAGGSGIPGGKLN